MTEELQRPTADVAEVAEVEATTHLDLM